MECRKLSIWTKPPKTSSLTFFQYKSGARTLRERPLDSREASDKTRLEMVENIIVTDQEEGSLWMNSAFWFYDYQNAIFGLFNGAQQKLLELSLLPFALQSLPDRTPL